MPAGLRIGSPTPTPDERLLDRFRRLPTAIISDSMWRLSAGGARLRPMGPAVFCAPALTVKTAPGDNLFVHKALELVRPGEAIVVDAGGDLTNAIIGERMLRIAERRGVAALVINGAVRDVAVLRDAALPVFAAGVTHRGPYKFGPGEINYPVAIDGMVVCAGDIIVGDDDGVVCIRRADAAEVCAEAEHRAEREQRVDPCEEPRDWIDEKLTALGCDFENRAAAE